MLFHSVSAGDEMPLLRPPSFTSIPPRRVTSKGMVWLELDPPLASNSARDEALADGGPHNNTAGARRALRPMRPATDTMGTSDRSKARRGPTTTADNPR